MKKKRQEMILSIIASNEIETQEEIAESLSKAGYSVTQATVSRDIRELKLTKAANENGKQIYVSFPKNSQSNGDRISRIIKDSVISVDCAGNLFVIKTVIGMGMAVAVNIDELKNPEIIGTIAGDDVVFCAIRDASKAVELKEQYISILSG